MNSLLKEKEEGVRKLKETLRKSQQEGDDSSKSAVFVLIVWGACPM